MFADTKGQVQKSPKPVDRLESLDQSHLKNITIFPIVPNSGLITKIKYFRAESQNWENRMTISVNFSEIGFTVYLYDAGDTTSEEFKNLGFSLVVVSAGWGEFLDSFLQLNVNLFKEIFVRRRTKILVTKFGLLYLEYC